MVKYISCSKCNNNGKTSHACTCDDPHHSVWFDICTPDELAGMAQECMQLKSDLRKLVDDGYELDRRKYYKMSREDILERIIQLIKRGE